jgi:hypothetical protein
MRKRIRKAPIKKKPKTKINKHLIEMNEWNQKGYENLMKRLPYKRRINENNKWL